MRYRATVKDGVWREVGERILPGKEPVRLIEMNLTRIGDSNWPASGAVPQQWTGARRSLHSKESMRIGAILFLALAGCSAVDTEMPQNYSEAKAAWEKRKAKSDYQRYGNEFMQFNNHFRLDEKYGCGDLAPGPVNLLLVISKPDDGQFAVVARVFADVDNAKANCFISTYSAVQTKAPPYLPFVLQMSMQ